MRIRMLVEVSSTTGELMFEKGKEYIVAEAYADGAIVAMSERERLEGVFIGECELLTNG